LERKWRKHSFPCSKKVPHAMMYRRINLFIRLAENLATKKKHQGNIGSLWCPCYTLGIKKILFQRLELPLFPRQEDDIVWDTNLWQSCREMFNIIFSNILDNTVK
jgi:hypothetical protein